MKLIKFLAPAIITLASMSSVQAAPNDVSFDNYIQKLNVNLQNFSDILTKTDALHLKSSPKVKFDESTYNSSSKTTTNVDKSTVECKVDMGAMVFVNPDSYNPQESFFKQINELAKNGQITELTLNTMFIASHELAHCDFGALGTKTTKNIKFFSEQHSLIDNFSLNDTIFNSNSLQFQPQLLTTLNELYADIYGTANLLRTFVYNPTPENQKLAKELKLDTSQILPYAHKFADIRYKTDMSMFKEDPFHTSYEGLNLMLKPENLEKFKNAKTQEEVRIESVKLASKAFINLMKKHPEIIAGSKKMVSENIGKNLRANIILASHDILSGKVENTTVHNITQSFLTSSTTEYTFDAKNGLIKQNGYNETEEIVSKAIHKFIEDKDNVKEVLKSVNGQFELLERLSKNQKIEEYSARNVQIVEKITLKINN